MIPYGNLKSNKKYWHIYQQCSMKNENQFASILKPRKSTRNFKR